MNKSMASIVALTSGIMQFIFSCTKTGAVQGSGQFTGSWALHSRKYAAMTAEGDTGTYIWETLYGNPATYTFHSNGGLNFLPEVHNKATYSFHEKDSLLEIRPDTAVFLNLCFDYYQPDPNLYPFPQRGNHTPGTLKVTYLSADSFELTAKYTQTGFYYSDSFVIVRTGFHRE